MGNQLFPGNRLDPVVLMPDWRLWPEPNGEGAIIVGSNGVAKAHHAGIGVVGLEQRPCLGVIDVYGPEILAGGSGGSVSA